MQLLDTTIPGCFRLVPTVHQDARGSFVKTYQRVLFESLGLPATFAEEFYTTSKQGVLRGLHFQVPPQDHVKLVHCLSGEVLDAVVDLRRGSPTYKAFEVFELSGANGVGLLIPAGLAHGFYTLSDNAVMAYKTSTVHSPEHDSGIHWASAGIAWPTEGPLTSERDGRFARLDAFDSPFVYRLGSEGAGEVMGGH